MEATEALRQTLPEAAKDIALNVSSVLSGGSLTDEQRWGVALACTYTLRNAALRDAIAKDAADKTSEAIREDAKAAAAIMGMTNIYYRFRHLVGKETYTQRPARLRMNRIANPSGDKVTFELMCLAVSAITGCEVCIKSHEKVVIEGGLTEEQVQDAVRIASTLHAAAISLEMGS